MAYRPYYFTHRFFFKFWVNFIQTNIWCSNESDLRWFVSNQAWKVIEWNLSSYWIPSFYKILYPFIHTSRFRLQARWIMLVGLHNETVTWSDRTQQSVYRKVTSGVRYPNFSYSTSITHRRDLVKTLYWHARNSNIPDSMKRGKTPIRKTLKQKLSQKIHPHPHPK